jgi:hypothetical protein
MSSAHFAPGSHASATALPSQIVYLLQGALVMTNWVCICGTYVKDKRFCPRCKYVRFTLENRPLIEGELELGTFFDGTVFSIPVSALATHTLVAGQTGTGKSRFAMKLVVEAANYAMQDAIKILVVDVEGEWKNLIPLLNGKTEYYDVKSNLRINPFDLKDPGLIRELMRETVFKGIEKEYGDLSAQMNYVLQEAIAESKNMADLITKIRDYNDRSLNSLAKTKTALLVRLAPFMRSPLKEIFLCTSSNPDLSKLSLTNIIIDLHSLDALVAYHQEVRLIYNTISTYYLRQMLTRLTADKVANMFVADEAQLLVPRILQKIIITESWPATEFATRLRKRGCGLLLITQSPSNLERDIVKNTATKAIFRLQSFEDVKIIAESAGFTDTTEYQFLSDNFAKLPNREAIVCISGQDPFYASSLVFDLVEFAPEVDSKRDVEPLMTFQMHESEDEIEFLDSIKFEPFLSVIERKAYLGWDIRKFNRIADSLLHRKIINKMKVKLGRGSPRILFQRAGQVPSIKHEFYVHWIIERLARKGLVLRKNKVGPDIEIPSLNTAIEVELGKSDIRGNIQRNLRKFTKVVVCSDDKKLLQALSRQMKDKQISFLSIEKVPFFF